MQSVALSKDQIKLVFVYSNKTLQDILLHEHLGEFERNHGEYMKVHHTLTRHTEGEWLGNQGRITKEFLLKCNLPPPSEDTIIAYCGPAPFNKTIEDILINEMGYTKDMIHKF